MSRLLPLELHRHILEFLWDPHTPDSSSYRTFASCAQTCSHWRAAARPFIFRFLIIRYEDQIAILENQIRKEPCIGNWVQNVRIEGSSTSVKLAFICDISVDEPEISWLR